MDYNFEGIKQAIKDRLSLQESWMQVLFHSVYERLIDVVAYVIDKYVYIAEFEAKEASFKTASKRESLVTLCNYISYIPHRKVGSSGSVEVIGDPTFEDPIPYTWTGKNVTIQRWHKFTNDNSSIIVYASELVTYNAGQVGSAIVPVKEGDPKEYLYIAEGIDNEIVTLYDNSIDNDEIEIFIVNNDNNIIATVSITDSLYFINDLDNYWCEIENSLDYESVRFIFGDGISQKKLNVGDRVLIKYATTQGDEGVISSAGVITKSVDPFYQADGTLTTLYVRNVEEISDGKAIEDIESIRENARNLFFAGYRCAANRDWVIILNSAPFVYKSTVWSIEDVGGTTLSSEQNLVFITAVSSDGTDITTSQKVELEKDYLDPNKSITEVISWQTLQKLYIKFDVQAKITNQEIEEVDQNIKDTLEQAYGILYTDFQINAYESNYITILDQIDEIVYHKTIASYMEKNTDALESNKKIKVSYTSSDTSITEDQIYLTNESLEIWLERKIADEWGEPFQIAYSSGSQLMGMNGFTISSSNINYVTNTYSYIVTEILNDTSGLIYGVQNPGENDPLGYIISVVYKTNDGTLQQKNNIRLPYFYQITDIDINFINTELSYY